MARGGAPTEKYVKGKLVSQRTFRDLVVTAVRASGTDGADASDVAKKLDDPAWLTADNRHLVSMTLANLANRGVLTRLERGRYTTNEVRIETFGITASESVERSVIASLTARGGFASLKELAADFDIQRATHPSEYVAIQRALKGSSMIRKDFHVHGFYNLRLDLIHAMPLRGRWLRLLNLHSHALLSEMDAPDLADAACGRRFAQIGSAFDEAMREKVSAITEAYNENAEVREAMTAFAASYPFTNDLLAAHLAPYDLHSGEKARRIKSQGGNDLGVIQARDEAETAFQHYDLPTMIYDSFVEGDFEAHMAAPLSFYKAMGGWLGLDPVMLSRGLAAPKLT